VGTPYLDTRLLFERIARHFTEGHYSLTKTLVFGDSSCTQQLKNANWESELQPFKELDLRKNAYKGRFDVKSQINADSNLSITYKSNDRHSDLRLVTVTLNPQDSTLLNLKAYFETRNNLYSASKMLAFYRDSLLTVKGIQKVKLGNTFSYSIYGRINASQ
jgi:hypothetical protein